MESLDSVVQTALDILKQYAEEFGEVFEDQLIVSLSPSKVLYSNGLTHANCARAYSSLKRLGLVVVVNGGRGAKDLTILVEPDKSVLDRRLELEALSRRGKKTTADAALLEHYNQQEAQLKTKLKKVRSARTKLLANIEADKTE